MQRPFDMKEHLLGYSFVRIFLSIPLPCESFDWQPAAKISTAGLVVQYEIFGNYRFGSYTYRTFLACQTITSVPLPVQVQPTALGLPACIILVSVCLKYCTDEFRL
jgi:hypothetical protein